jgi:hypothetical protein
VQHTVHHAILADRSQYGQQPIPRQTYWSSNVLVIGIRDSNICLRRERTSPANQIVWWRGGGHLLKRRVLAELGHSQIQIEPLCNEAAPRPFRILNPAC